jgi:uncharacterized protein (DUF58 family)
MKDALQWPPEWRAWWHNHVALGHFLMALTLVMAFVAWNRGLALLYGLVALLIALCVLGAYWPWALLRQVRLQPGHRALSGRVGEPIAFALIIDSDQALRGAQALVSWRRIRRQALDQPPTSDSPTDNRQTLSARVFENGTHWVTLDGKLSRGLWQLEAVDLKTAAPIGVWPLRKRFQPPALETAFCHLGPQSLDLAPPSPQWWSGHQQEALQPRQEAGGTGLLMGLRAFVPGDNLRHIDWRTTARRQEPIVRDWAREEMPSLALWVNTHKALDIGEGDKNAFEQQLMLVQALASWALGLGWPVSLAGACRLELTQMTQLSMLSDQLAELDPIDPPAGGTEHPEPLPGTKRIQVTFEADTQPLAPLSGAACHWRVVFLMDSYRFPLKRLAQPKPERQGHCIWIPIGASSVLSQVFQTLQSDSRPHTTASR